jgi:hypothetical protein
VPDDSAAANTAASRAKQTTARGNRDGKVTRGR